MQPAFYRRYLLIVLMMVLAFNFADRSVLGLLLQDIKVDLDLSDTQLGVLSGIAFALFYSTMGIPIARWADRGNRVTIVAVTATLGSVMVVLCGTAASFIQLLAIRIGVAVGEAGGIPTSNSLIADYFTRAELPRAIGIYMLGTSVSVVIGFFIGGWLNEFYGWRMTFMLVGLPGLALAALAWLTLREPRHGRRPDAAELSSKQAQQSLKAVVRVLWVNNTFRHLLWGYSVLYFFTCGIFKWQPAFFIRSYGLQTGELGTWLAVIYGGGGLLGTYLGGALAARYAAHDERLQLKVMAVLVAIFGVISACVYLSPNRNLAFGMLTIAFVGLAMYTGPLLATVQKVVPEHMRAMSIAALFLFANLIGLGLGPLTAGALSDAYRPWAAEESLRYALLTLCPGFLWASWHLWQGSRTVTGDLAVRF